ncbi:MAG: hypothetical protein UU16_C0023G0014 [Candidatus Woesebacteria bacterium GW2011_GWA2_40_7]|nr:MAG: hypothetical protein UU16_C0023G0014 [Candidatus Woesebacteria bacterium GW2011_GWA2_40_7]
MILLGVGFFAMLVGLVFLATYGQKPDPATLSYKKEDVDRPKTEVLSSLIDIGEMKVNEIKEVSFQLKNVGTKPLQILNINSSCNCTFGQIIYKNLTTKQYGMHKQSGYVTDVFPGDTANVKVIYNPSIMPVYGNVSRDVYISTNDPDNPKITFTIKTSVR